MPPLCILLIYFLPQHSPYDIHRQIYALARFAEQARRENHCNHLTPQLSFGPKVASGEWISHFQMPSNFKRRSSIMPASMTREQNFLILLVSCGISSVTSTWTLSAVVLAEAKNECALLVRLQSDRVRTECCHIHKVTQPLGCLLRRRRNAVHRLRCIAPTNCVILLVANRNEQRRQ